MRLKILISVTLAIVVGYSLFWYYVAGEVIERVDIWTEQQKSKGLSVQHDDIIVAGFPYRIELSLNNLNVTRVGKDISSFVLTSPSITIVAFPWQLNHAVMLSPGGKFYMGNKKHPDFFLNLGRIRASTLVELSKRKFKNASFIVDKMTWGMGGVENSTAISEARDVRLHLAKPDVSIDDSGMDTPVAMKLYLEGRDVIAQDLPVGIFGKKADHMLIDIELHSEELPSYTKKSLGAWRDSGGTLVIYNLDVTSGKMDLELDGAIALDEDLKPVGALSSKIYGIDHVVTVISQLSAFGTEQGKQALEELKTMSKVEKSGPHKGEKRLDLSVSFQSGLLFLGPIPVYELTPIIQ